MSQFGMGLGYPGRGLDTRCLARKGRGRRSQEWRHHAAPNGGAVALEAGCAASAA